MVAIRIQDAVVLAAEHLMGRRLDQAERVVSAILAQAPEEPSALHLKALILRQRNETPAALTVLDQVARLAPEFAEAHINRGNALNSLGREAEAMVAYETGLALNPAQAEAWNNLGALRHRNGLRDAAVAAFRQAIRFDPQHREARRNLSVALSELIPGWHIAMMNDTLRNRAYDQALRRAIAPGDHVLEIGTGSGLLAMMAARAGAGRVTTCEMVPTLAAVAQEIIACNGYGEMIRVINLPSTQVTVEAMGGPADVLVSEILSSDFLSEQVLPTLTDARRRLIGPGAPVIPAAGSLRIALATGPQIAASLHVGMVDGFDLSLFNAVTPAKKAIDLKGMPLPLLSAPVSAFSFDFVADSHWTPAETQLEIPVTAQGLCYGVAQWIHLDMDGETAFSNTPENPQPASGWQPMLYAFAEPLPVDVGQTVTIQAFHDCNRPWFQRG